MSNQLNINPAMDKIARDNGLGHWSCVSPLDAGMWVRSDGCHYANGVYVDTKNDYVSEIHGLFPFPALRLCDEKYPIGKDWQQPTTDLPEKTIESKGCSGCFFMRETNGYLYSCVVDINLKIDDYVFEQGLRHPQCPLLTNSIKVVKNG